ncbi:hypothetical protein NDU88_011547 [Pleurodeles waltl]|uniref:WAP domain-containing protein n=1 Tax=Pleurodeles waltl TaxID=8319 RepID=A0AAV7S2Y1_PLEWA|nr:hypothetical protein NDU88_011547 [Pleurodeles waltl]
MRASLGCLVPLALLAICKGGPSDHPEVKPGECPYQFRDYDTPPPYLHECNADSDCQGPQKCCIIFSIRECRNAVPAKGKPGICPGQQRDMFPELEDLCMTDRDCPEEQKCCFFHGGNTCMNAVKATTFGCPKKDALCKRPRMTTCEDDTDCHGYERCCESHCVLPCKDPVIEKKGSCPLPPSYPTCTDFHSPPTNKCSTNQQCPGDEKCCEYGCRLQCKKPLQEKPGFCPAFNRSNCLFSTPAPAECSSDNQCPGTQRCCCNGNCRMGCTKTVTVKPGTCPPPSAQCGLPLPAQQCEDDSDCPGRKKCCSQCGIRCTNPSENPGFCPVDPEKEKQCSYLPPPQCSSDADCEAHEKCCLFGCGVQCVKALPVKPGMCPPAVAKCKPPLADPECHDDGDCPLNKKCCQLCGSKCLDAVPDHEGVCPSFISKSLVCPAVYAPSCGHDWSCAADEKCCTVGCQRKCVKALKEKMGDCAKVTNVTEAIDACNKCNNDKDCPGYDRCCTGLKGRECRQPLFVGLPVPEED